MCDYLFIPFVPILLLSFICHLGAEESSKKAFATQSVLIIQPLAIFTLQIWTAHASTFTYSLKVQFHCSSIWTVSALGMCISITEADAIRISMHSQRYDALKLHKWSSLRCDTIHPYYDAVRFDFDSILFNVMRFDAIQCNGKIWSLLFLWFRQQIINQLTWVV